MSTITTADDTEIFYKDWGTGQPIVFSHGWPLSSDDWDTQMLFFLAQGYRVIAHDRRGHGRSTQTVGGHDLDHYADGGEVVRFLARHGQSRAAEAAIISAHHTRRRHRRRPARLPQIVTVKRLSCNAIGFSR